MIGLPKMTMKVVVLTVFLYSIFVADAFASLLTIANHSFEEPGATSFTEELGEFFTDRVISGWQGNGPFAFSEGVLRAKQGVSYTGITATDGLQVGYSNGGIISQVLSEVLMPNFEYSLYVDIGNRLGSPFLGYRIGLFAGGNLLVINNSSVIPIDGGFATAKISYFASTFDPNLGKNLEIRLTSTPSQTFEGRQVQFDNVRLSAEAVPEPSTLAFWSICLVSLLFVHLKRSIRCEHL
jgi:hypothetical protein